MQQQQMAKQSTLFFQILLGTRDRQALFVPTILSPPPSPKGTPQANPLLWFAGLLLAFAEGCSKPLKGGTSFALNWVCSVRPCPHNQAFRFSRKLASMPGGRGGGGRGAAWGGRGGPGPGPRPAPPTWLRLGSYVCDAQGLHCGNSNGLAASCGSLLSPPIQATISKDFMRVSETSHRGAARGCRAAAGAAPKGGHGSPGNHWRRRCSCPRPGRHI